MGGGPGSYFDFARLSFYVPRASGLTHNPNPASIWPSKYGAGRLLSVFLSSILQFLSGCFEKGFFSVDGSGRGRGSLNGEWNPQPAAESARREIACESL